MATTFAMLFCWMSPKPERMIIAALCVDCFVLILVAAIKLGEML